MWKNDGKFGNQLKDKAEENVRSIKEVEAGIAKKRKVEIVDNYKASLILSKSASKRAFMASQLPEEWQPQTAVDPASGKVTSDPAKILEAERNKYHKLWKAQDNEAPFGFALPWGATSL